LLKEVSPNASSLVMSMRSIGYSFNNAIADIIDNSITAEADRIEIECIWDGENPTVEIIDNGNGMNREELIEAMRPGTKSPLSERSEEDLGRFGLGLKTASFSQCKRLIVKTYQDSIFNQAIWDLDNVQKLNKWFLEIEDSKEVDYEYKKGTIIKWEKIDTLSHKGREDAEENFNSVVNELSKHIGITFHRYINGDQRKINFVVNGINCEAYDPFFSDRSTPLPREKIDTNILSCEIRGFTLPSKNKCSLSDWELYAGDEGYMANQGFYLYRNGRLISKPTWFGLEKKTPKRKLCRVRIDIDNKSDLLWQLDVKKSSAVPPPIVKRRLKKILKALVSPAERNFDDKVKRLTNREIIPVWERKKKSDSIFYSINREHPFIKEFLEKLDQFYIDKFERILYLIDFGVPVEGIYADFSDDKNINEIETNALNDLITLAREMIHYISRQDNINEKQAKLSISTSEPFRSNWAEIEEHL
tara:strand:+ start:269 stop:1690 length:1422 start_codon:yes stop_codon:yes gene_type:complete